MSDEEQLSLKERVREIILIELDWWDSTTHTSFDARTRGEVIMVDVRVHGLGGRIQEQKTFKLTLEEV